MKYTKKFFALLLALTFSLGIFAGCTPQKTINTNAMSEADISDFSQLQASQNYTNTVDQDQTDQEEIISTEETIKLEKQYCEVSIDQNFYEDRLHVTMTPSTYPKEYTIEDFADISCVEILYEATLYNVAGTQKKIPRRYYSLKIAEPSKENIIKAIRTLEGREDVLCAEPEFPIYTDATPTDAEYTAGRQWGIDKISLPSAWDITTGSNTVRVGIIDSGVKLNHTDIDNRVNTSLSKNYNPEFSTPFGDESGHGTHIAGIIGATANDGGMVGACWNVEIIVFRVGTGEVSNGVEILNGGWICEAVEDAENLGIDILNCSFSGEGSFDLLEEAMQNFSGLIVCTAGNRNANCDNNLYYPIGFQLDNMISVAASTENDTKRSNSSYGDQCIDLFAPGENIRSCNLSGGFTNKSGTSFAAPFVTGVAALIKAAKQNITPQAIKFYIVNNVDYVSALAPYCSSDGRLNAYAALQAATTVTPHSHSYTSNYISISAAYHRSYCSCGDYITERHTFSQSGTSQVCTKCGHTISMMKDDPIFEIQ